MRRFGRWLVDVAESAIAFAHDALERAADRLGVGEMPAGCASEPTTVEELINSLRGESQPEADPAKMAGEAAPRPLHPRDLAGSVDEVAEVVAAEQEDAPPGVSQIIGPVGIAPIYLAPRPLHPRDLAGAEVRAAVPVPLRTFERLNALLWLGKRERERLNREGLVS